MADASGESEENVTAFSCKKKKLSEVWNHFDKCQNKNFAKCRHCLREYKTSGNTSNLLEHLKRAHPLKSNDVPANVNTIDKFVKTQETYEPSSLKKRNIDRAVARMVAQDVQPYSIVEDVGFKNLIKLLDPRYELPSRTTLQNVHMKNMYDEVKAILKSQLENVKYCSVTTDGWTSKSGTNYLTVTCHYIYKFELKSAVLATQPLNCEFNHGSSNIAETLKSILTDWNVFEKIETIVTDNAASMKKACEILQKKHLPCFSHTLNLVVQDALACHNMKPLLTQAKQIVGFFKSSSIAYAHFKSEQAAIKPYSLIQEVSTRWNSVYHMLERILKTRDALCSALLKIQKAPPPLSAEQFSAIEDLCLVFAPIEAATKRMSAAKTVTISLVIPTVFGLIGKLERLTKIMKSELGGEICSLLIDRLKCRLLPYINRTMARMATIIDPRFKKEGFLSQNVAQQAASALESEIAFLKKDENQSPNNEIVENAVEDLFDFVNVNILQKQKTSRSDAIVMMRQFLEQQNAPQDMDPLNYWKVRLLNEHMHILILYLFPRLMRLSLVK